MRVGHGRNGGDVVDIGDFINEIEAAATLEAQAKGFRLVVPPVMDGLVVEADRHELAAAVRNLVQNAVKFTRPGTTVNLRVRPSAGRVRIEVQDECGGLPGGCPDDLFWPFEQRGQDRSGLGLGLAFSRKVVEASGGTISVTKSSGAWLRVCHRAAALVRPVQASPASTAPTDSSGRGRHEALHGLVLRVERVEDGHQAGDRQQVVIPLVHVQQLQPTRGL